KNASDLSGNVLKGGAGVDIVKISGSGTEIDLTQGSSGIEAVVGSHRQSGEIVDLKLSALSGSALSGGTGKKAFVALIGPDGTVNVTETGKFKLVGELDASGNGFATDGTALSASATAALAALETSAGSVAGTLAKLYTGSGKSAKQLDALSHLNAYVFSDGKS